MISGARILCLVSGLVLTGFGGMTYFAAGMSSDSANKIAAEGQTTEAEITGKYIRASNAGTIYRNGRREEKPGFPDHMIKYRFVVPDGRSFDSEQRVGQDDYPKYEMGMILEVTYWPTDPNTSTLFPGAFSHDAGKGYIATAILMPIGLILVLIGAAGPRLRRFIRRLSRSTET